MSGFIVIAKFVSGTDMKDVFAVVQEEQAKVAELTAKGRLGAIHLSLPRQTVFLEVFAEDESDAASVIESLPMAKWWTLDVYPIAAPVLP